ncbi:MULTISPECIES: hypothetical protein [unclassified Gordonia (in: high G+C Gram-positive bacteria)]|uniref:hypothetical protein n=1 Tax=unclassified Gordonia (in: high G+C Gram-positive bacteria) TaxID=2657482 RepID=UPI001FFFDDD7|nr:MULTISPECIES: hypothetical protein [unclassified Gordonia (in: high G+C Gram-positive bacteria)]UQE75506.1 hypothetical protein MYK68_02465 [Gordonia sp. PP30]
MKKTLKRAAVAVTAAGAIGAGSLFATAPAQAATPGNLTMLGGVDCTFQAWGPNWKPNPLWQMKRWMGVKNTGGSTMNNVTITEIGGATKTVPAKKKGQKDSFGKVIAKDTRAGQLLPGQTYISVNTKWAGCWPSSISGYTIGAENEAFQIQDNFGFWMNVRQQQAPPNAPAPTTPAN